MRTRKYYIVFLKIFPYYIIGNKISFAGNSVVVYEKKSTRDGDLKNYNLNDVKEIWYVSRWHVMNNEGIVVEKGKIERIL